MPQSLITRELMAQGLIARGGHETYFSKPNAKSPNHTKPEATRPNLTRLQTRKYGSRDHKVLFSGAQCIVLKAHKIQLSRLSLSVGLCFQPSQTLAIISGLINKSRENINCGLKNYQFSKIHL